MDQIRYIVRDETKIAVREQTRTVVREEIPLIVERALRPLQAQIERLERKIEGLEQTLARRSHQG